VKVSSAQVLSKLLVEVVGSWLQPAQIRLESRFAELPVALQQLERELELAQSLKLAGHLAQVFLPG
jgi:hypothetical protein